mmetsp:Transcript_14328/g.21010  ORF Transcript_14328/g.21010 Transcript_14328/m.21010 type:complete len:85 (+) Transcript_14328:1006-1260(+)
MPAGGVRFLEDYDFVEDQVDFLASGVSSSHNNENREIYDDGYVSEAGVLSDEKINKQGGTEKERAERSERVYVGCPPREHIIKH